MKLIFLPVLGGLLFFGIIQLGKSYCNHPDNRLTPAPWMQTQIRNELTPFYEKKLSLNTMRVHFSKELESRMLIEIQIKNNKIKDFPISAIKNSWIYSRYKMFRSALKELAKNYLLPDVTIFLCLWDFYGEDSSFPLFVFAKNQYLSGQIMIPDYSAIFRSYEVAAGDVFKNISPIPWNEKCAKFVWRGSTSQGIALTQENFHTISRFTLCQLSENYPKVIDAGFTLYFPDAESIPELKKYQKEHLAYETLIKNKYQLWIDGTTASYSESGWRFFSNSVVLKPDSDNIQWYYQLIEPGKHYISVKTNLEDLVEKIEFLQRNDSYAEEIAKNGRTFALHYLMRKELLRYLYCAIWEYSKLSFRS